MKNGIVKVVKVRAGEKCPVVIGRSRSEWARSDEEDIFVMDPERVKAGASYRVDNPTGCARGKDEYDVYVVDVVRAGKAIVGIFDVVGHHASDENNPEYWEDRCIYVVVKEVQHEA